MELSTGFNLESFENDKKDFLAFWNEIIPLLKNSPQFNYLWLCERMDDFHSKYFDKMSIVNPELSEIEILKLRSFRNELSVIIDNQYYLMKDDAIDSDCSLVKLLFIDFLSGFEKIQPRTAYKIEAVFDHCNNDFFDSLDYVENEFSNLLGTAERWPVISPPNIDYRKLCWMSKDEFMSNINSEIVRVYTEKNSFHCNLQIKTK